MRVCIDISAAVHRRAGLGRYAQELTRALLACEQRMPSPALSYSAFYHQRGQAHLDPPFDRLPCITTPLSVKPWRLATMLAYLASVGMERFFPGVDLFHATEHLLPRFKRLPAVFTLHDLIFRFDPGSHKLLNRIYLSSMVPRFLRAARAVVAVSECTRRDAIRLYHVPEEKIHVIYEGVDTRFEPVRERELLQAVREKYALPERFILHVGTIEPRKNLPRLFEAFAALDVGCQNLQPATCNLQPAPHLVLAGKTGWLSDETFQCAQALGERLVFTGYVADEDLPALYTLAELLVMPSLYEGFGLPVLEAMRCGTPVACSNTSSLPEVVGEAALLFDPRDVRSMAEALGRGLSDAALRAELSARGLARAAGFDWARAAQQTRQVYLETAR
ncbi:MAG: glycosyltransferase family 4 protein [Thermoflexales bacterium]|nr:glycosyltransferase family 4 protein [Thermoflexales bacterium]